MKLRDNRVEKSPRSPINRVEKSPRSPKKTAQPKGLKLQKQVEQFRRYIREEDEDSVEEAAPSETDRYHFQTSSVTSVKKQFFYDAAIAVVIGCTDYDLVLDADGKQRF